MTYTPIDPSEPVDPSKPVHPLDALRSRADAAKGFEFEDMLEEYIKEVFGATDIWKPEVDIGIDHIWRRP